MTADELAAFRALVRERLCAGEQPIAHEFAAADLAACGLDGRAPPFAIIASPELDKSVGRCVSRPSSCHHLLGMDSGVHACILGPIVKTDQQSPIPQNLQLLMLLEDAAGLRAWQACSDTRREGTASARRVKPAHSG
jgi:hypothetical protein